MSTDVEMFETIQNWNRWDDARGQQQTLPDAETRTPALRALYATRDLIASLNTGRWSMITAARLSGAGWEEIGRALNEPASVVRADFTEMVAEIAESCPDSTSLDRYCKAM